MLECVTLGRGVCVCAQMCMFYMRVCTCVRVCVCFCVNVVRCKSISGGWAHLVFGHGLYPL